MLLASLVAPALACPTIATGEGSPLSFDVAQVAIVRQGDQTTFSVSVNPFGDPQSFALVLPVPEVLQESQVKTIDGTIFATLDGYTAPRHVSDAGCGGYGYYYDEAGGCDDSGMAVPADDSSGTTTGAVEVEASYLVGDYQITILSAEESGALQSWLDAHGYALPPGADAVLSEYIEGGSYFLAAKVADTAATADGSPLAPLQVTYASDIFAIPIRLATLNSPGEQDMVIYAVTSAADGLVGIANYPEFEVPDGCVWGAPPDDFAAFYDERFTEGWAESGGAGWAVEFSGGPYSCNPCTGTTVDASQLAQLGWTGAFEDHFLTRIHMRYTPEQATQELTLYASGAQDSDVLAYADDYEQNYSCIDAFCDGTATPKVETKDACGDDGGIFGAAGDCGCNGGGAPASAAAIAMVTLAARRRSRP